MPSPKLTKLELRIMEMLWSKGPSSIRELLDEFPEPERLAYTNRLFDLLSQLVPEGVEGRVPYKGPLAEFVFQLVGGLRAGMGYCGCSTIDDLRTKTRFIQVTPASVQEGHPHDIVITQEAPNYSSFSGENDLGRGPA